MGRRLVECFLNGRCRLSNGFDESRLYNTTRLKTGVASLPYLIELDRTPYKISVNDFYLSSFEQYTTSRVKSTKVYFSNAFSNKIFGQHLIYAF